MNIGEINELLQTSVLEGAVPGVVALAANREGVIYQGAFGRRSTNSDTPMTIDSVFWIASMSKAVTTVAAMQLVEKGLLHLDEPVNRLLPDLVPLKIIEGFDNEGLPRLREPVRPLTLRHLLTHTSGFAYEFFNPDILAYMSREQIPTVLACMNVSLNIPLVCDPGEKWEYSISLDWTGKAIEAASGQSLNDYMRDNIFVPLGMNDTGFIIQPSMRSRMAAMHQREENGLLTPIDFEMPQEPEFFMGGGGLYSTGEDYLKLLRMILQGGSLDGVRILQPETIKEMGRNQIGEINVGPLISAIPSLSKDAEFFPGMIKKWGLGFMLTTEDAPTGRSSESMSWVGLCNSFFWIDPVKQITGLMLTQVLPFADAQVLDLYDRFETLIYRQL
ncbi:MAG: serine hydrolase domain-containing protein [Syntrophomonas sp.]